MKGSSLPELATENINAESGEQALDKNGCVETRNLDPVPEDHLEEAQSPLRKMNMLDVQNFRKKRVSCLSGSNNKRLVSRMDGEDNHTQDMLS